MSIIETSFHLKVNHKNSLLSLNDLTNNRSKEFQPAATQQIGTFFGNNFRQILFLCETYLFVDVRTLFADVILTF